MSTRFETDGKTFSHVVHTRGVTVMIQTETNFIRGTLHLRDNERVKDVLNSSEQFLAITSAQLFDPKGSTLLYETDFLALNRLSLVWVFEDETGQKELGNG